MENPGNLSPRWSRPRDIPAVLLRRANLAHTISVAAVVGSILFAINQLDVVLAGRATGVTWLRVALTYLVPFFVSNYGVLVASREARRGRDRTSPAGQNGISRRDDP